MDTRDKYKIALITGGTGGHIFPAVALAEQLHQLKHETLLLADKRFLKYLSQLPPWLSYKIIPSGSLIGGLCKKIFSLIKITIGIVFSLFYFSRFKPDLVVGFGGYISVPPVIAARILRIPVILHEQNSVLGNANKFLKGIAKAITATFENTIGLNYNKKNIILVKNPVRKSVLKFATPYKFTPDQKEIVILITGGSQGAAILSKVLPKAIALLDKSITSRLKIYHQTREEDVEMVKFKYQKNDINAIVAKFFDNIPELIAKSSLVISRAGASTIAELVTIGRPAIFIPIQKSIGNHQFLNAASLEEKSASWIITEQSLSPESCNTLLTKLLTNKDLLTDATKKLAEVNAATKTELVDVVVNFCQQSHKKVYKH